MLNESLSACMLSKQMTCVWARWLFADQLASTHPALHMSDHQICVFNRIASVGLYVGLIMCSSQEIMPHIKFIKM